MKKFTIGLVIGLSVIALAGFAPSLATERLSVLCATETGNCLEGWSGTDIELYSDRGSTKTLDIEGSTGASTFAGAMTITAGGLTVTAGGATLSDGDLVVADDLRVTAQTSITVTDAGAFTPTGTYQPIAAAGEVTPTITAGATAGDMVVLINTSAQVVNLADSGTLKLSAAAALNQFDNLVLWSDGTNWIEISRTDN